MGKVTKLKPFHSEKVWGYENWNLSTHQNGCSTVLGSKENLRDYLKEELPILIKIIKANESLSVQVHPNDAYANEHEGDNGKTECWYILDAKPGSHLICGLKSGFDKESLRKVIEENKIEEYLETIPVKSGDMIYIPAGTVHAICGGIKLLEVQQSSDVTYRIYDWGRDREMHIEKSLDVIDYEGVNKGGKIENFTTLKTPYFTVDKIIIEKDYFHVVDGEFETITATKGNGILKFDNEEIILNEEETVYLSKGVSYCIQGNLEVIKTIN